MGNLLETLGGVLQQFADHLQQIIGGCTDTSYPEAVGFAFKDLAEAPADPLFEKYLSVDSLQHLQHHYASVRDALTPQQVAGFDQSLQTTLGDSGTVVFGGLGVLALALAMLFDVLAAQAKGQTPLPNPIHQVFHGEGEALAEMRNAISNCLNHLPQIRNDTGKTKLENCGLQVGGALHNYTLEVLDQARQSGPDYVNATERHHVLNSFLLYAHLIIYASRIESGLNPLELFDKEAERMKLLEVFAPNVTHAVLNWDQQNKTCTHPHFVLALLLSESEDRQSNFSINLKNHSSGLAGLLKHFKKEPEDFVIKNRVSSADRLTFQDKD